MTRRWLILFVLVPLFSLAAPARAAGPNTIVLESHAGRRPKDADRLLGALWAEFRQLGYIAGAELSKRIEDEISLPALTSETEVLEAIRLVDAGWEHWITGDFSQAVDSLEKSVELFHRNPAAFAAHADRRDLLLKALSGLALAHNRLGHGGPAQRALAEIVRSFPDRDFSRSAFGPEAHKLYRGVAKDIRDQRPGALRVKVDDEAAAIYINERYAGTGELYETDMPPGRYRVYAQKGSVPGRLRLVDIASGADKVLSIDWELDAATRTTGFSGVLFVDESTRAELEAEKATTVAREVGASGVIVVGIREYQGRRSIVGTLLSVDSGKPRRSAAIAVEPTLPPDEMVRSLARFLAGDEPGPGLIVTSPLAGIGGSSGSSIATGTSEGGRDYGAWKWLSLGVGVAAVTTGVVFVQLDGPILDGDGDYTGEMYDTRAAGIGLAVGGVALAGTGLLLWLLERPPDAVAPVAAPVAGGGAASPLALRGPSSVQVSAGCELARCSGPGCGVRSWVQGDLCRLL